MNSIVSIDAWEQIALVQPGVLNSAVSDAAAPHGLLYAPDPASTTYSGQVPRSGVAGVLNRSGFSSVILFKTELIRKRRPWRTVEQVELATLEWVWWFNNQRLHSEIGNVPPIEIEQAYHAETHPVLATAIHGNT